MYQRHSRLLMILWEHCFEAQGRERTAADMIHDVNLFGETWLASTLLLEKGVSPCEDRGRKAKVWTLNRDRRARAPDHGPVRAESNNKTIYGTRRVF